MSDETDDLLRQILELQRQQFEESKRREAERKADFLIQFAETQNRILKRHFIGIVFIGLVITSGVGLALSLMVADRSQRWIAPLSPPTPTLPTY